MRRLLPLLMLAALAAPSSSAAAVKQPALASDAAAMTAVSQAAVKVEKCRSKTIDYTRCDSAGEVKLPRGVLHEASTPHGYEMSARSRQGRRFTINRAQAALLATCTPAGRGRCGPAGTWRPKPKPVMSPAWGTEWLPHERELVARILAVADLIERCGAAAGDYTGCRSAKVDALARAGWHAFQIELSVDGFHIYTVSGGSTEFVYQRLPDGSIDRSCRFYTPLVSPCDGEHW